MNEHSILYLRGDTVNKGTSEIALGIDQAQCLNLRGRHVSCTRCADSCPVKALVLTADEVRLDGERCTACGACLPICPSGALLLSGFDPQQFLETVADSAEVHIHCSRSGHPDAGNTVPCLQVLDARLLAAVAADGAQTVVLHGADHCSDCDRGDARATIEQMHAELKKWFTGLPVHLTVEQGVQIETGVQSGAEQVDLGRRNFLRLANAKPDHGVSKWSDEVVPEREQAALRWPLLSSNGSACRPSSYQELLAVRAELLPWRDHYLPWRARKFSDACSVCLTCAQLCPTGALVAEETRSTISILFHLRLCTDCGLCENLCPENAISNTYVTGPEVLSTPSYPVMHRDLHKCKNCTRNFVPGPGSGELCTTCQNEYNVTNEWRAMLTKLP